METNYQAQIKRTWVEHPKNGKAVFRAEYFDELSQKSRKRSKTLDKETAQAKRKALNEIIDEIQKSYDRFNNRSISIGELAQKYKDYIAAGKAGLHYQTGYQYSRNIDMFLSTIDESILAENIKRTYFNRYFDELLTKFSYTYVNLRRSALTGMYNFGLDYGYVQVNPLLGYKIRGEIKPKLKTIDDKYFTGEELMKLLAEFKKRKRYDIVELLEWLYLTGMRVGEACAVYPSNIYFSRGNYYVKVVGTQIYKHHSSNRTEKGKKVDFGNRKSVIEKQDTTKTYDSTRIIKLAPQAVALYKKHQNSDSYLFVKQSEPASGLVPRYYGTPFQGQSLNKTIKSTAKSIGINKTITTHFFRHTFVCRHAAYDLPFNEDFIGQIGHKDVETTRRIYDHITSMNHEDLKDGFHKLDNNLADFTKK